MSTSAELFSTPTLERLPDANRHVLAKWSLPVHHCPDIQDRADALRHIHDAPPQHATGNHDLDDKQRRRQLLFSRAVDRPMTPHEVKALRTGKLPTAPPAASKKYIELAAAVFGEAFTRQQTSLDQTTDDRIKAAYRIVREMARSKRLLSADEPLLLAIHSASPIELDMWNMPTESPALPSTFEYLQRPEAGVNQQYLTLAADALRLRQEFWPWVQSNHGLHAEAPDHPDMPEDVFDLEAQHVPQVPAQAAVAVRAGLPLMPPPVPLRFIDPSTGQILPSYEPTPAMDPNINLYVRAVSATADYLGVYHGSEKEPEQGRRGMLGLASTQLVRLSMPTRMQLIAWEYILINKTLKLLVEEGGRATYQYILTHYGFNHLETSGLLRMTKRFAKDLVNSDRAEDRAIMLLRCEDMMKRARGALDLKAEQNAMKQMSQILGLTRTEDDETLSDFVSVVQKATQQRMAVAATKRLSAPNNADTQFAIED